MLKRQILGYFENPFYGRGNDVKVLWQWKIVVDLHVLSQYRFESLERQFCSDVSQKIAREKQEKD